MCASAPCSDWLAPGHVHALGLASRRLALPTMVVAPVKRTYDWRTLLAKFKEEMKDTNEANLFSLDPELSERRYSQSVFKLLAYP